MNLSFSIHFESIERFIEHWYSCYEYKSEWKYDNNIGKPFTESSRQQLFEWKNGSKLSKRKAKSVENNYPLLFIGSCEQRYLDHKSSGSAIWNIFFIHCLFPEKWPIFDQHVYRAMLYLKHGLIKEIPNSNKDKYKAYLVEYIPFFQSLPKYNERKVDKALVTFGRFLKNAKKYL